MSGRRNWITKALGISTTLVLIATIVTSSATGSSAGAPKVSGAWARTSTGMMGAAYLTIRGNGTRDKLVAAAAPKSLAKTTELHKTSMMDDGMMSMSPVKSIPVPASGTTRLKPGGYHVMLVGLKKHLVAGATFPLTLTFATAGKQTVTVTVRRS